MDGPDNNIGVAGAAALVEGLKEMTNLKELNLDRECCMVGIVCQVAVLYGHARHCRVSIPHSYSHSLCV